MKSYILPKFIGALLLAAICFTAADSWATLPKPIQIHATVVFVDHQTQTVVVKPSQPTKEPKPFVLDWNKDTQFIKNGAAASAADLKQATPVTIHYKRVSFRNPLLKKVIWTDEADQNP